MTKDKRGAHASNALIVFPLCYLAWPRSGISAEPGRSAMWSVIRPVSAFGILLSIGVGSALPVAALDRDAIDREAKAIEAKMIAWRRDIHQNPELGNREVRTSGLVAEHLKRLGYEVRERVAHTGVVAVLKGGKPGPVVALRADMDALPVTEEVDLPFASKVKT